MAFTFDQELTYMTTHLIIAREVALGRYSIAVRKLPE